MVIRIIKYGHIWFFTNGSSLYIFIDHQSCQPLIFDINQLGDEFNDTRQVVIKAHRHKKL